MHTENFTIDYSCKRQIIEYLSELLPHDQTAILSLTLNLESVYLGNLAGFMVTSKQSKTLRVSEFQEYQVCDGLDRCCTAIYIISKE